MGYQKNIFKKVILIIVIVKKLLDFLKKVLKSDIPIETTFQSRFGPQEWLQPYTDKTLEKLPKERKKKYFSNMSGIFF